MAATMDSKLETETKTSVVYNETSHASVAAAVVRGGRPAKGNRKCNFCGRSGHIEEKCWKKHGKPPNFPGGTAHVSSNTVPPALTSGFTLTKEEYEKFLQLSTGASANLASSPGNQATSLLSSASSSLWVVDSGASQHMTGMRHLLHSIDAHIPQSTVTLADGSVRKVLASGSIPLTTDIDLTSVHYVPDFPFNLLSVAKLVDTLKCVVTFGPTSFVLQDPRSMRMIGGGPRKGDLYYFRSDSLPRSASASTTAVLLSGSPLLWHCRYGHPSLESLRKLVPEMSKVVSFECQSCQFGKHHRLSYPGRVNKRSQSPFSLVHSDVWGPVRTSSYTGFRYFISFVDDFSRMTWVYLMKNRESVLSIVKNFHQLIKVQFGFNIKILQSDNALEYVQNAMTDFCSSVGMIHRTSCPHTPQQNGVAERKNRHLLDVTRTIMFQSNVPKHFWSDAVLTACFLINRQPSSVLQGKTPFSVLHPDVDPFPLPLKVFGFSAYVHNTDPRIDKLSPRSIQTIFLGYSSTSKGYKCYCPHLRRMFVSRDVTFHESTPYYCGATSKGENMSVAEGEPPVIICESMSHHIDSEGETPPDSERELPTNGEGEPPPPVQPPTQLQVYNRRGRPNQEEVAAPVPVPSPSESTSEIPATTQELDIPVALRKGIRSCTIRHPISGVCCLSRLSKQARSFAQGIDSVSVPRNHLDALTDDGWKQAMQLEMSALLQNKTWDLTDLPPGKQVVGCRWVFTVKHNPDGSVERLKARLVAKGYTQTFGVDFFETFSPVARLNSVRIIISLAATFDWPLYQLDIKNAFLHGDLQEEVYMEQPPGFVAQGECQKVCRLRKAIYGLKQSPRAWFDKFTEAVLQIGLSRSVTDHSLFFSNSSAGLVIVVVYVDDIIITGSDTPGISRVKEGLQRRFHTKDLGQLRYFLGIEVLRSRSGINLSQRKYALDLLHETGMTESKPVSTPMYYHEKGSFGDYAYSDPGYYRKIVGKLIYLTVTRPDISFAVSVVSQHMSSPQQSHWTAVCRILRYVKGGPGKGITYYRPITPVTSLDLTGYADADWAGSTQDRRSTSGYCTFLGNHLITWKSKKQNVVARSSSEAEYRAMAHACCELQWVQSILSELKLSVRSPTTLKCDNQSAIHIAKNPVFHERTKHIEVDCHFIRDLIRSGKIVTPHVRSEDQLADILTKPLGPSIFQNLCNKLGIHNVYTPA